MKIEYSYSKGTQQVNYATAVDEKQYLRAKKRLEKKGFTVEVVSGIRGHSTKSTDTRP